MHFHRIHACENRSSVTFISLRHGLAYKKKNQQEYLNQVLPRNYNVSLAYTNALNTFLVCFSLSSAIPILTWVCALTMFGLFIVEKYKLFEHSKKPPRMSKNLIKISIYCLFIGLILHLIFSISMLGNHTIFMIPYSEFLTESDEKFDIKKELNVSYFFK